MQGIGNQAAEVFLAITFDDAPVVGPGYNSGRGVCDFFSVERAEGSFCRWNNPFASGLLGRPGRRPHL